MSDGSLYVKIGNSEVKMSDIWADREAFDEIGPDGIRELIKEDILSFVDEIDLLNRCEFYWRTS